MTTTNDNLVFTEESTYIATPCPPYCDLPPMHSVDNLGGAEGDFRIHNGPRFGRFLFGFAEEYVHSPGQLRVSVDISAEGEPALTATELGQLVADATAALEWLEAQQ